ncbi:UNC93-like protein MFSD11 [Eumeta japonica]|uniref:UNC93-like protein MFSD11 n=1 Tax=Eumeta variegata TaxID=151549 RepID=A0A4C1XSL5_EUMVA|nr:UNC93-like protein MFSD11 [Eumeta japonica]
MKLNVFTPYETTRTQDSGVPKESLQGLYIKTILDSISTDDPSFKGDGYTSLAIIYATLAVCNWLAPSLITFTGPRGAMLIGATTYL